MENPAASRIERCQEAADVAHQLIAYSANKGITVEQADYQAVFDVLNSGDPSTLSSEQEYKFWTAYSNLAKNIEGGLDPLGIYYTRLFETGGGAHTSATAPLSWALRRAARAATSPGSLTQPAAQDLPSHVARSSRSSNAARCDGLAPSARIIRAASSSACRSKPSGTGACAISPGKFAAISLMREMSPVSVATAAGHSDTWYTRCN